MVSRIESQGVARYIESEAITDRGVSAGVGFVRLGGVDVDAGRRSAFIFGTSGAEIGRANIGRAKVNKLAVRQFRQVISVEHGHLPCTTGSSRTDFIVVG
jgi:hypothetical protein